MSSDPKSQSITATKERVSQELRTGLNDILGCASLLESSVDGSDHETLQKILRTGRQMLDLLGGTLPASETLPGASSNGRCAEGVQTVLYVEDNEANFTLMSRILESRPRIHLVRAPNGETGVKLAAEAKPHLVLLDLHLPDFPGAEVLRRMRADNSTISIPVIVISADATPSQIERLLSGGARNYLTKPFSMEMLLAVVDEALAENEVTTST